ncbi:hypothetical protein [Cylindrospermum sp. FACHB-282]|uniref:hypothetical protein n=1 Tax=Cylindrospermum sp. FACHB-282 TaxID=2692794 RepID=UPI001687C3EF|nr:hypothetical protein [Cylindrospermum sp. FACHB-282]MBD2387258.1 hypothetical protein [Cylindrospermum sp. FACHB-282]
MKRAISFLATLMLTFVVAFGFVVNTASAEIFTCRLSQTQPCIQVLDAHDELDLFFNSLSNLDVTFQSQTARQTVQVTPTIGSQVQPPVNIQPGGITARNYPTIGSTAAVFVNNSAVTPSPVRLSIVGSI